MAESHLIQTGVYGLDAIFLGGILKGNIILVEGAPGTGKTLLGLEFIYRGAAHFNEPGIIVVFEAARNGSCATPPASTGTWQNSSSRTR